jgi:hypothetical protein
MQGIFGYWLLIKGFRNLYIILADMTKYKTNTFPLLVFGCPKIKTNVYRYIYENVAERAQSI